MGQGLISDDVINQIRDRVDIAEIVGQHVALTRAGQNLKGLCPFHQEKSPSFTVSSSRQIFHCFGCGAGGNVYTFLMKLTGAGFPEIVRDLGRKVGVDVPESAGGYSSEARTQLGRLERLNAAAGAYYQRMLLDNTTGAPARAYLDGRGIQHNTMAQFQIGYALPEWDGLTKAMLKEGFAPADLVAAGLSIPRDQSGQQKAAVSGHYDRFRARVMFPIMDLRKRVVAFGGRILGEGMPKYLNSPETPLFKKGQTLFALEAAREAAGAATHIDHCGRVFRCRGVAPGRHPPCGRHIGHSPDRRTHHRDQALCLQCCAAVRSRSGRGTGCTADVGFIR
ncbi:MAG: hypothetical protein IPM88_03195 [Nitrospira sp.]|nr:hypothetical protein [Nitrospira sp.]